MWLTVHLNSVKITKPTRYHFVWYFFLFINCSKYFGQFHGYHQELTTEWCDRHVWYNAVTIGGVKLGHVYCVWNDMFLCFRGFLTFTGLRKDTKTYEHIVPYTINMLEFNTAYCYRTIPQKPSHHSVFSSWLLAWNFPKYVEQFIKRNKVLHKVTSIWFCYLHW